MWTLVGTFSTVIAPASARTMNHIELVHLVFVIREGNEQHSAALVCAGLQAEPHDQWATVGKASHSPCREAIEWCATIEFIVTICGAT
jgi:hypothetical protein